jgi:hypothetical protein
MIEVVDAFLSEYNNITAVGDRKKELMFLGSRRVVLGNYMSELMLGVASI